MADDDYLRRAELDRLTEILGPDFEIPRWLQQKRDQEPFAAPVNMEDYMLGFDNPALLDSVDGDDEELHELRYVAGELAKELNFRNFRFLTKSDLERFGSIRGPWLPFLDPPYNDPSAQPGVVLVASNGPHFLTLKVVGERWEVTSGAPTECIPADFSSASAVSSNTPKTSAAEPNPTFEALHIGPGSRSTARFLYNYLDDFYEAGFSVDEVIYHFDLLEDALVFRETMRSVCSKLLMDPNELFVRADFASFDQFVKWIRVGEALEEDLQSDWFLAGSESVLVKSMENLGFNFVESVDLLHRNLSK